MNNKKDPNLAPKILPENNSKTITDFNENRIRPIKYCTVKGPYLTIIAIGAIIKVIACIIWSSG